MDARQLLKVHQQYIARKRMLEPERYIAMLEFRDSCSGALDMPPLGPGRDPEAFFQDLLRVDARSALMKDFLSGAPLDPARLYDLLGVSLDEYELLLQVLNPIKQEVPEKLVLMTFDDATLDHIELAAPILEKYGGKGNFFVCEMEVGMHGGPGFSDKSRYMSWPQIKELADRGHDIVNHSLHHEFTYLSGDDAYANAEAAGIEDRCAQYGIQKPTVFGYPGGQCTARHETILCRRGYLWARGDMNGDAFHRAGTAHYDPLTDSPLAMPSFNNAPMMTPRRLAEVVCSATDGRIAIFAYHTVTGEDFVHMRFEDQVKQICDLGGRCITFSELSDYIDPIKAYEYTHL